MRSILNISLPLDMRKQIEQSVKDGGYMTTSEFVRDIIRDWQARKALEGFNADKALMKKGELKKLTSLRDIA